jgi:hypothetical protein
MSTDGPQPTQGAPKKKRRRKVGRLFFGIVFLSLVFCFGRPLAPRFFFPTSDLLFFIEFPGTSQAESQEVEFKSTNELFET